jgi:NAD(P)-dependent dehydrogenase (short-subunit alcohol dehydrogenase family)
MKLYRKRTVVTGASQGLGLTIACHFARNGADVLLCARDGVLLEQARNQVAGEAPDDKQLVLATTADVSSEDDVGRLATLAARHWEHIDVLVCNAGVHGPIGPIQEVEWPAWVQAVHVNLCGTVLCCRAFLPYLRRSRRGKVFLLSGGGATKPMPFRSAYAASKAAVVRFGETLAEELRDAGIDVNSIAPGALNTRLLDEVLAAGPERVGRSFYDAAVKQSESGGSSPENAAELIVYLASEEGDGITGKLISAVWDPWNTFVEHRQDLLTSDIYTLRRIVPAERGFSWG